MNTPLELWLAELHSRDGNGAVPLEVRGRLDTSWRPVDLGPALAGNLCRPAPTILRRDDDIGLLYRGRVNGFHGDSGIGKSWAALITAKGELEVDAHVLWVDFEDPDPITLVGRLRDDLNVDANGIRERLHYYCPNDLFSEGALVELEGAIREHDVTLLVIDSLGEAFALEAVDENKDVDVGPWLRRVARRLADAGPAVLLIDHSTKANDNPLHPSGSKRKRAAMTGASYLVQAPQPFSKGNGGVLTLTCAKDRHGTHRRGKVAAELAFAHVDGGMVVDVVAPSAEDTDAPDVKVRRAAKAAVAAVKDTDGPVSKNMIEQLMTGRAQLKRAGIEAAVATGALRVEKDARGALMHTYVRDFEDHPLGYLEGSR